MDLKTSFFVVNTSTHGHRLVFSSRSGKLKRINDELYHRLFVAPNLSLEGVPQEVIDGLTDSKILVPNSEDEKKTIFQENQEISRNESSYKITIAVTQFCNQDCIYCGQDNTIYNVLSKSHIDFLVKEIRSYINAHNPKELSITFYGGEPSTALETVVDIASVIKQLCDEKSVSFHAGMITNGVNLTEKAINELLKVNIKQYQITLDGLETHHNLRRPLKTGEKSFDKTYRTIKRLSEHENALINLRVNIDKSNINSIQELLSLLSSDGLHKKVFMDLSPVHPWGSNIANYCYESLSLAEYAEIELDLLTYMVLEDFHVNLLPKRQKSPCLATNLNPRNSLVVDANGRFSCCWEIPYSEVKPHKKFAHYIRNNDEQKALFEVGSLEEGVQKPNWLGQTFIQLFKEETIECITCPLLPSCAGGCPVRYIQDAKPLCPSWRYNLEGRMALNYAIDHVGGIEALKNKVKV